MKKIVWSIILICMLSSTSFGEDIHIEVNDEIMTFENSPYIIDDRTMVPLKFIMDTLGYRVEWLAETKQVKMIRGQKSILLTIGEEQIYVNDQVYVTDVVPRIIEDRTYVPLAIITRATGADVVWHDETRTVKISEKMDYLNVFYGRGSYENFTDVNNELQHVNQMSYAWSRVEINDGIVSLNTTSKNGNTMFYPTGHELVTDVSQKKMLNLYAEGDYDLIFTQKDVLIQDIRNKILTPDFDEPEFDGVVVDFENLSVEDFETYLAFISQLKEAIPSVAIDVALQPRAYDYEKLLPQVDHMILMLHDYESKKDVVVNIHQNYVDQKTAPIQLIKDDLDMILANIEPWDRGKVLLQINLAVVQWQGQTVYEAKRYTPGYDKLIERMETLSFDDFYYHENGELPYVQYIADGMNNTIWYENENSVMEKIKLVYDYDLGGVSLWQLGNLPSKAYETSTEKFHLNIWHKLMENSKSID